MEKYIDEFIRIKETSGLTSSTIQIYRRFIEIFCKDKIKPSEIKEQDIIEYFYAVQKMKCSSSSKSRMMKAVKSYCEYLMSSNKLILNEKCLHYHVKKDEGLPKDIWSESEIDLILSKITAKKFTKLRAIIELAYSCGLRVREIVHADLFDLNLEEKTLLIRESKCKDRVLPVTNKAMLAIQEYLVKRRRIKSKTNALFVTCSGERITAYNIQSSLYKLSKRLNFNKNLTVHCIRNSIATHLLRRGMDFVLISKFLGHSHLTTTTIYTRVVPIDLKEMIDEKHPRNSMGD